MSVGAAGHSKVGIRTWDVKRQAMTSKESKRKSMINSGVLSGEAIPKANVANLMILPRTWISGIFREMKHFQFSCSVISDAVTPWTAAHQASLPIANSQSLLKTHFRNRKILIMFSKQLRQVAVGQHS